MKHLEHAPGGMLEFLKELSHCGSHVLLVTRSTTPQVVDEVRQGAAALSPAKKLFGPLIPQRLAMALETIDGRESISYMRCR